MCRTIHAIYKKNNTDLYLQGNLSNTTFVGM